MRRVCVAISIIAVVSVLPSVAAAADPPRSAAEAGGPTGRVDPGFQLLERAVVTEGFEGGVVPPSGWALHQTNAAETWQTATSSPHAGTYYANCEYDPALNPQAEILYSPQVTPTTAFMVRLWSFGSLYWGAGDPEDNYDINVYLDEDTTWDNGNETLVYTADDDWVTTWVWAQSVVDLNAYADGTSYYVAFAYEGSDGAEGAVDDIEILTDGGEPQSPAACDAGDATVLEEHFESWPPTGWTILDNVGTCAWESTATTGRTNYAGGDGEAADADSDDCGSGTTMDTELWTPAMNLSGYSEASLNFIAAYNYLSGDSFSVDVSDDGGGTWTNLLSWSEDHDAYGPGELVELDLTPYLSGNVVVRFHYVSPGWSWWAEVDDVYVCGVGGAAEGADLEVTKTSDAGEMMYPGDQVTFSFTVTNNGPDDATGVTVTDVLPPELGFVSCTAGSHDAGTHTWTWDIGALSNGANASCDVVVEVMPGANGTIENTGVVAGNEDDPTPANDSSVAAFAASSREPGIPALTTGGIAVMLLALAGLAVLILRRRA